MVVAVAANEATKEHIAAATKGFELIAPASIDWEVGNAFSAMLKRRRITVEQAIAGLESYLQIKVEKVTIDLNASLKLASRFNIYAYDAYVLQCALENSLPLFTLDSNMERTAQTVGISVMRVEP